MIIVGNMVGCYSTLGKSLILEDEEGNQVVGVIVGQETVFTATADDIVAGRIAANEDGIVVGTHDCEKAI